MSNDEMFAAALTSLNVEYQRLTKLMEGLNTHADAFVEKHGDSYFCTDVTRQLMETAMAVGRINKKIVKPLQHIIPWRY